MVASHRYNEIVTPRESAGGPLRWFGIREHTFQVGRGEQLPDLVLLTSSFGEEVGTGSHESPSGDESRTDLLQSNGGMH
jgi:hypothetical protein